LQWTWLPFAAAIHRFAADAPDCEATAKNMRRVSEAAPGPDETARQ